MLEVSAFHLEKQKSFIPEKIWFGTFETVYEKIKQNTGTKGLLC